MVRNKLCWDANNAVGPLRYLRPTITYFVPCDRILQRAHCSLSGRSLSRFHEATRNIATPPEWDPSPSQCYPQDYVRGYLGGERHRESKEPKKTTRTARSGVERTNHEATAPATLIYLADLSFTERLEY